MATDAEAIAEIYLAAARAAWGHIVGDATLAALSSPVATWEERLRALPPAEAVVVAAGPGGLDGFVWVRPAPDDDAGEVAMLYTRPSVWGAGVGRALLAHGCSLLLDAGFTRAVLWTEERNHRPRAVYEAAGWRLDGRARERVWLGHPLRELRYTREL